MLTKTLRSVIIFGEWLCQFSQMELAEAIPSDPMLCNEQAPGSATGAMDEAGAVQNSGYESPSSGTSTEDAVLLRQKKNLWEPEILHRRRPLQKFRNKHGLFLCRLSLRL